MVSEVEHLKGLILQKDEQIATLQAEVRRLEARLKGNHAQGTHFAFQTDVAHRAPGGIDGEDD